MSRKIAAVLRAAKRKIAKRERWAKGGEAFDKDGKSVSFSSTRACSWCVVGATWSVAPPIDAMRAVDALDRQVPKVGVIDYNDAPRRQHRHIMALFDRAIAAEEASS